MTEFTPEMEAAVNQIGGNVKELGEITQANDLASIFHAIEEAELAYKEQELPLELLKQVQHNQKIILQAHERLNHLSRIVAEDLKKKAEQKANDAFREVEKHMKALVGNSDYPKLFVTQIAGTTSTAIKTLINKKLPSDRYLRGSSFDAFTEDSNVFRVSNFNGVDLTKAERNKLLFLRLDGKEALMAKTACSDKCVVIDDPDASKWSSLVIAAHISKTQLDIHWHNDHFQTSYKIVKALMEK